MSNLISCNCDSLYICNLQEISNFESATFSSTSFFTVFNIFSIFSSLSLQFLNVCIFIDSFPQMSSTTNTCFEFTLLYNIMSVGLVKTGIISYPKLSRKCKAAWWMLEDLPQPELPVTTMQLLEGINENMWRVPRVSENVASSFSHSLISRLCWATKNMNVFLILIYWLFSLFDIYHFIISF